ncbi:MAG: NADH-quinone oxidoreductase subunit L [Deltaproteobacteria bacterium]|jgi:NADH-quinone oxidoreductase subunit L|nr:NADH-quinone oxidoreductase subunit L [Deltaproteobacteria bacterium]MBT4526146.1 NADH-quinone oxidoreductase subunit L [Deltaproteobacteria bacterium]
MTYIQSVIPWVPILPLFGAIILGLFGKKIYDTLGENVTGILGCLTPMISAILAFSAFFKMLSVETGNRIIQIPLTEWITVADFQIEWTFRYDPLSSVMIMIVTGIGTLIHIYGMGYMHKDQSFWRFFSYMNLFLASMLMLVLGDNLIMMFLGWEGVGLCSYLLIGFWFSEEANAVAGKKAFIVNRIGDLGFLAGMFLMIMYSSQLFGNVSLSFGEMQSRIGDLSQVTFWGFPLLEVIGLCFFIGAMGKSAQIPLYVWLPDAMAGPTPVSALIHAATMVTAGVYMMGRMYFLYSLAPHVLGFVSLIAALTCFISATIGMAQFDIKKVLAYSTVSQLGYMFLAMSVGAFSAGIFHLLTHAAFKAALFMGSGSVIVALHHKQDMRNMGGLLKKMPITGWSFIAATFAIMGFPLTSGFFSKDEILWKAFIQGSPTLWLVGFIAAGITSFYMWRLVFMTFFGENRSDEHTWEHCKEQPKRTVIPIAILAIAAITIGFLNVPHFLGGHSNFTEYLSPVVKDLSITPAEHYQNVLDTAQGKVVHESHVDHTALEWTLMVASVAWTFFTAFLAWFFYMKNPKAREYIMSGVWAQKIFIILYNKYYVDEFYEMVVLTPIRKLFLFLAAFDQMVVDGLVNFAGFLGRHLSAFIGLFDQNIVDGAVNGTAWSFQTGGKGFSFLQSSKIQTVIGTSIVIFIIVIVSFILYIG